MNVIIIITIHINIAPSFIHIHMHTHNQGEEHDDEIGGTAGIILECLKSLNSDVRAVVVQNILFCGGGSMIPGKRK